MFYNLLQASDEWLDDRGLYSVLQVLYQLEFRAFFAVVTSFVIVLLFGKPVIRWLMQQKIGDSPEFYHADLNQLMASKAATPTMGGMLICSSILISVVLLADLRNEYVHLAIWVLLWVVVVGGLDDWLTLTSHRRRPGSREGLSEGAAPPDRRARASGPARRIVLRRAAPARPSAQTASCRVL